MFCFRPNWRLVRGIICAFACMFALTAASAQEDRASSDILLRGTVVTMDPRRTILENGNVLIHDGQITAVWQGRKVPDGVLIVNAIKPDLGPDALIFPGLINLHDHPNYDVLHLWPAPASHKQPDLGRPLGTEPYANRYQWNRMSGNESPEFDRLIANPSNLLVDLLKLGPEVGKYAEVKAILGGETTFAGGEDQATRGFLIRNVDQTNFGRDRIELHVKKIDDLKDDLEDEGFHTDLTDLLDRMHDGEIDAWLVHLAEGVRDGQRRPGDPDSSRSEFYTLLDKGLLTDMTVIVHGNGLEPVDFVLMRSAPNIRTRGPGDGLGAKLVWSPLSNLLLYGQTALVYHALNAGIVVSLGTDWSPSGSRNLLDELKIADITLRDSRLLESDRDLIQSLSITGKSDEGVRAAEILLDKLLVEMVTVNPAKTVRWSNEVGSIEVGKFADLMVITKPIHSPTRNMPDSPYRNLIDATEKDVRLVLVNGQPLAGDVALMALLNPGDYEVIESTSGCFQKAVDVTNPVLRNGGTETFAYIQQTLSDALKALGDTSKLKHLLGKDDLSDLAFQLYLASEFRFERSIAVNIEGIQLAPVLVEDDDFYFHLLGGDLLRPSGLIGDTSPPFGLYPANLNHMSPGWGNPFDASEYRDRYYDFCRTVD
jgi:5-methylthioadenosine/S-adenosylhomocysteine deaminase